MLRSVLKNIISTAVAPSRTVKVFRVCVGLKLCVLFRVRLLGCVVGGLRSRLAHICQMCALCQAMRQEALEDVCLLLVFLLHHTSSPQMYPPVLMVKTASVKPILCTDSFLAGIISCTDMELASGPSWQPFCDALPQSHAVAYLLYIHRGFWTSAA